MHDDADPVVGLLWDANAGSFNLAHKWSRTAAEKTPSKFCQVRSMYVHIVCTKIACLHRSCGCLASFGWTFGRSSFQTHGPMPDEGIHR